MQPGGADVYNNVPKDYNGNVGSFTGCIASL